MSIAEQKETPLEMAERQANGICQCFVSIMDIRKANPDADLSPIKAELLELHSLIGDSLKGWK